MALPELFANPSTPGTSAALTTLTGSVTAGSTTITVAAAAPAGLQAAGQFRVLVDSEYMIVTAGASGTTWTVSRGAEGSTAASHASGAGVWHVLTQGALGGQSDAAAGVPSLRSLGTGAQQAMPGNATPGGVPSGTAGGDLGGTYPNPSVTTWAGQSRAQVVAGNPPQAHQSSHAPGGSDALTGLTDANVAAANKDGTAATPSLRTLGTGAQQAMPGNSVVGVSSVFGRSGAVVAASGDYTPAQVGALPAGTTGPGGSAGANLGATPTLPAAANYNVFWGVANVNTTITVPTPTVGQDFTLVVDEPVAGGSTIALSGALNWPNGTMTWQTGASARNAVEFFCVDGVHWDAYPITGPALLKASNNLSDVTSAATARTNLGLGTAATAAIDTTAADIAMNGTQAAGATGKVADAGHVHPTDTSRAPVASPTFTGITTAPEFSASGLTGAVAASRYVGGTTSGAPTTGTFAIGDFVVDQTGKVWICTTAGTPGTWTSAGPIVDTVASDFQMNGTAAAGAVGKVADAGHVHPTDTSRAPLASPTFTGTPAAPTPAVDDNTTKVSTTAFVLGQTSTASPAMNGTAAAGTSTRFARADHVHPSDTTRAISSLWRPSGAKTETFGRDRLSSNGLSAMVSGRLYLVGGCQLPAGTAVNTVTFYSGTSGAGPYEVDSIAATGATSGTFQVSFTWNGNVYTTVTAINWNDSFTTIQADLLAAQRTGAIAFSTDAGASGLVCSGGPLNTGAVTVTFQNNANGPVTAQTVSGSTIVGATATFTRTTNGVLPSNQWACLVDQSGNVLVKSTDATTSAWGASAAKAFTLSSTYTAPTDIGVYAGLVVVASTVPNLQGTTSASTAGLATSIAPMTAAVANTGLTNPASLGATIGAQTFTGNLGYATIG